MATTTLQTIRNGIMALTLCASLAAGSLGFAGSAEARVPDSDRQTTTGIICGTIQDEFDRHRAEYDNARTAEDKAFWGKKLTGDIESWYAAGCNYTYGKVSYRTVAVATSPDTAGVETVSPGTSTGGKTLEQGALSSGIFERGSLRR